jgi:hypothetical protein
VGAAYHRTMAIDEEIDAAIMSNVTSDWAKVATVAVKSMEQLKLPDTGEHFEVVCRRMEALVAARRIEAQGDVSLPRRSEVRAWGEKGDPRPPPRDPWIRTRGLGVRSCVSAFFAYLILLTSGILIYYLFPVLFGVAVFGLVSGFAGMMSARGQGRIPALSIVGFLLNLLPAYASLAIIAAVLFPRYFR